MRRAASAIAVLASLALLISGCGASDDLDVGSGHSESHSSHESHEPHSSHESAPTSDAEATSAQTPAIVDECADHPLASPASPGEVFCHAYYAMELLDVAYDAPAEEAEPHWPYEAADDPVWMLVEFRVTSLISAPGLSTGQVVPTLTDTTGQMASVGEVVGDSASIPDYESDEFTAVYTFDRSETDRSNVLLCTTFLISVDKSIGCTHI
ncbi:hypothetical protein [Cumulibacter soli]|uniref:hypothetical protein n=1 Tax=Cumulibacter soli TaxID=2546344 RepID=UPI0010680768|nr:hypothetical protein [Cumulibacter soli]